MTSKKSGFTLMEVTLAMAIMAVGVIAMVGLYPLGFRENRHSREDVAGAILADAVLNPVVAALSATNVEWSAWVNLLGNASKPKLLPSEGWNDYVKNTKNYQPVSRSSMKSKANQVIQQLCALYEGAGNPASEAQSAAQQLGNLGYALVATPGRIQNENGTWSWDLSRICLSFRATRNPGQLFSQPLYYTEVHFQGDPTK